MATDPRWVRIAEKNIEEILTDHAYCEQKAASSAISIIVRFPEHAELVQAMSALAQEEMEHFQRVHQHLTRRGYVLGRERRDDYVHDIRRFFAERGGNRELDLVNSLLLAAMIEARSCERFRVLSEHINDAELSAFYAELMRSEAMHYTLFIGYARQFAPPHLDVDGLWEQFLAFEADVLKGYGVAERIHG